MNLSDYIQENADKKLEVAEAIGQLGHVDRAVLYLWVTGYTQAEIADIFGYSQQRISQILANISKRSQNVVVVNGKEI